MATNEARQQTLSLPIPAQKLYGNWVRHAQVESACARLALWLVRGGNVWLSSADVAGKSHFIHALKVEHSQLALLLPDVTCPNHIQQLRIWLEKAENHTHWMLDLPAQQMSTALYYAVFHLIERARAMNCSLLISWRREPDVILPPELESRLRVMERVDMAAPLADAQLQLLLQSVLKTMQWDMKETVLPTLLQYVPRDLPILLQAIQKLDVYSQANKVKMNATLALKVLGLKQA